MLFKKNNKKEKCENCGSGIEKNHSYCPVCGNSLVDKVKEKRDFGLLGKVDSEEVESPLSQGVGITDKLINSMFNSLIKSFDKQFKNQFKDIEEDVERTEIKGFPNGIKIKISGPFAEPIKRVQKKVVQKRVIDESQIQKMSSLPREKAKTNVKRLGNKVVYELSTPGVISPEDVFVSKLESGYEIKAIGDKKIYVNSLPVNLPIRKYSLMNNKLFVEFITPIE